jgi:hypothetical protein
MVDKLLVVESLDGLAQKARPVGVQRCQLIGQTHEPIIVGVHSSGVDFLAQSGRKPRQGGIR